MIGTILNQRFEITAELGRGGAGIVYGAHDTLLDRDVAVKILSQLSLGTEGRQKLLREAQAIAKMHHPNIVAVHDVGETDDYPYIVMEFIEGQNLYDTSPNGVLEIVEIASQICLALDHAHSHGIVHRDLKPENVIVDADGVAKLMDFGIARSVASRVTSEGEVIGTVFYLAPEIALGKEFDGKADLYSLGVMLYELTTGELPFAQGDPVAVISQHLHASVVPPRSKNPEVPPRLDDLIVQMMSKSPADRPNTAAEVQAVLAKPDLLDPEAEEVEAIGVIRRIARGRFVARERELDVARAVWNNVMAGEGQTLLVSGEAGIGKTRFVRELMTYVEVSGGNAYVGECYEEGNAPYAAFAQIIRTALRSESNNGMELTDFVLADLISIAPELTDNYPEVPPNPKLEPELEQRRLLESVVTFFSGLSNQSPQMLVIEDAQWADRGTLALLLHLSRRTKGRSILIVSTYRETELDVDDPLNLTLMELNRARLSTELKLNRFSENQTEAQMGAIFAEEITSDLLNGVHAATEGNPFFIEEVCKALVEDGQVFHTDDGWDRLSMDEIEIPRSVRIAIHSRVARLLPDHQDSLVLAAVLGREFDFDTLSEASDQDDEALIDALESASQAQLIKELKGEGGTKFAFLHSLTPSTLREHISTLRRRKLHAKVAEALCITSKDDFETLAYHFSAAGDDDLARLNYAKAGDRASTAYSNQEAVEYYLSSLALGPQERVQADLLSNLAEVLSRLGRRDEAIDNWMQASDIYAESGEWPQFAMCFTRMARDMGYPHDPAKALVLCNQGLSRMKKREETPELAGLLHETARAHYFLGQFAEGEPLCREALKMAERVNAKGVEAESLITLSLPYCVSTGNAVDQLQEAIKIAREEELLSIEVRARISLSILLFYEVGNCRAANEEAIESANINRKRGDINGELLNMQFPVWFLSVMGELSEAAHFLEGIDRLIENLESETRELHNERLYARSMYLFALGNVDEALAGYRTIMNQPRNRYSDTDVFWSAQELGFVLMALGRSEEAESVLSEVVKFAEKGMIWQPSLIRAQLSMVFTKQGKRNQARSMLKEAIESKPPGRQKWLNLIIDWAQACALATEGSWEAAFQMFSGTVSGMESIETHTFEMAVVRDWAEAYLARNETGDAERASELLNRALAAYQEMGADGWVGRVESRLAEVES